MKPKVLVLGHWKTGTTLLCNILKWSFNKKMNYDILTTTLNDYKYRVQNNTFKVFDNRNQLIETKLKKYIDQFGEEVVKFHTLNKCDVKDKHLFLSKVINDCFEVADCVTIPGINISEEFADELNLGSDGKILFTIRDYKSLYQKLKNMNLNENWGVAGLCENLTHSVAKYILMFLNFISKEGVEIIRLEDYDENNYKKQMDKIDKFITNNSSEKEHIYKQNHLNKAVIGHESSGDKYLKEKELYSKDIDTKLPDYIEKIFYKYYKISEHPYSKRLNMIQLDELISDKHQVKDYIKETYE